MTDQINRSTFKVNCSWHGFSCRESNQKACIWLSKRKTSPPPRSWVFNVSYVWCRQSLLAHSLELDSSNIESVALESLTWLISNPRRVSGLVKELDDPRWLSCFDHLSILATNSAIPEPSGRSTGIPGSWEKGELGLGNGLQATSPPWTRSWPSSFWLPPSPCCCWRRSCWASWSGWTRRGLYSFQVPGPQVQGSPCHQLVK